MVATLENFRKFQKLFYFTLLSIFLLVVYYANDKPTSAVSNRPVAADIEPRTVVGFQSDPPEPTRSNCSTFQEPRNFSSLRWRRLDRDSYFYSVHLDGRRGVLRIVALLRGDPEKRFYCRTWPDASFSEARKTELWVRSWDFAAPGRYLHPYLLSCPVTVAAKAVSVVNDPCQEPNIWFNVTSETPNFKNDFAICVKPLDYAEDITARLLEWLEFQFLVGAHSVFAYVHSLHPDTRRLAERYGDRVTLVEHSPPTADAEWKETWQRRRLEVALYNHCFYRHLDSHRFVVNLDLDEAIVPLVSGSWTELLRGPAVSNSASVSARNVYFFDEMGVDASIPSHLHMLRHVYRSANFTPPGFAQKSFFNTLYAEAVAHHYALRALLQPGGVRLMSGLDEGRARLHHYRARCPALMEKQCAEDLMKYRVEDKAIWRFREPLELAVALRRKMLGMKRE